MRAKHVLPQSGSRKKPGVINPWKNEKKNFTLLENFDSKCGMGYITSFISIYTLFQLYSFTKE
jgi:hypothetical protein